MIRTPVSLQSACVSGGLSLAQSISEPGSEEIDLTIHLVDLIGLLIGVPVSLRSLGGLVGRGGELGQSHRAQALSVPHGNQGNPSLAHRAASILQVVAGGPAET